MEKSVYARILNDCLKAAKGEALLRISEGKVSAVLGGDCHDYAVLDMEQIFLYSVGYLTKNFKGCSYLAGFYEHDMASALWELSGEDGLLELYNLGMGKLLTEDDCHAIEMLELLRLLAQEEGNDLEEKIIAEFQKEQGRPRMYMASRTKFGGKGNQHI